MIKAPAIYLTERDALGYDCVDYGVGGMDLTPTSMLEPNRPVTVVTAGSRIGS